MFKNLQSEVLKKLIQPIEPIDFFDNYFEKEALLIQNRAAGHYQPWIRPKEINDALKVGLIPPQNLQMNQKNKIPFIKWTALNHEKGIVADHQKIMNNLQQGNSLVINNFDKFNAGLQQFITQLKKELICDAWSNIYITPPKFQAFKRHYDSHDVLVMQIQGNKLWRLYDKPVQSPMRGQTMKALNIDVSQMECKKEFVLQEGDFLYIPSGLVHEAVAQDKASIHISVGLEHLKKINMINTLVNFANDDLFFRKSLQPSDLSEESATLFKEKMHQLINDIDYKKLFQVTANKFKLESKIQHNKKTNNQTNNTIKTNSIIKKLPNVEYELIEDGSFVHLKTNGKAKKYPLVIQSFIKELLQQKDGIAIDKMNNELSIEKRMDVVKLLIKDQLFEAK